MVEHCTSVSMVMGFLNLISELCSSFSTSIFSGFLAEHMDLRHFLTVGMLASGLFTIAFGLGYFWHVHYFAYFVTVQVREELFWC